MQATQTTSETLNISRDKLVSFVSRMFGGASGNPDPENPLKPGPWDPIIRKVLGRMKFFGPQPEPWRSVFGPHPEPWRSEFNMNRAILQFIAADRPEIWDAIGPGHFYSFDEAALNPQPLPPRAAFLAAFAQEVIDRVVLTQEIADAINQTGEQQGIIIVSGKLSLFVDDLCPEPIKIKIPFPKPKREENERLSALELLAAGAVFEQNASMTVNEGLRRELRNAGARLIETAIARM